MQRAVISVGNGSDCCGPGPTFVMKGKATFQPEVRESKDGVIFLPKLMVFMDLLNSSKE